MKNLNLPNLSANPGGGGFSDANIYLYFEANAGDTPAGQIGGLAPSNWVGKALSLATLEQGSTDGSIGYITDFSGRVWVSYGIGLDFTHGEPSPTNSADSNFNVRYDKVEITYSAATGNPQAPTAGVADLTSLDFFAIPMAIKSYDATGATLETVYSFQQTALKFGEGLSAISGNKALVAMSPNGKFPPLSPYPNANPDSKGTPYYPVRVIGPALAAAAGHTDWYPSFDGYLTSVKNVTQTFDGYFNGNKNFTTPNGLAQCYNFTANFNGTTLTLVGSGVLTSNETITIQNTWTDSGGMHHELGQTGIYGAAPDYTTTDSNNGPNDLYNAMVRDVMASFDLGFFDSSAIDPNTNKPFNSESSAYWWEAPKAFNALWSDSTTTHWDPYADYVYDNSDAYGNAYTDRWGRSPQVQLGNIGTKAIQQMEVDILPDTGSPIKPYNVDVNGQTIKCLNNVQQTTLDLTTSIPNNTALAGATIPVTVKLHSYDSNPAPSGSVQLYYKAPGASTPTAVYATPQAVNSANGTVNLTVPVTDIVTTGAYTITAAYSGDSHYAATTKTDLVVTIAKASTKITDSVSPSGVGFTVGAPISLQAQITRLSPAGGIPTGGTVTFYESAGAAGTTPNWQVIGTVPVKADPSGKTQAIATLSGNVPAGLTPGDYQVMATYSGSSSDNAPSGAANLAPPQTVAIIPSN